MPAIPDLWRKVSALDGRADFAAWFGDTHPVEIEIGCGKGAFLAAVADLRPDRNYIGVEKEGKYLKRARIKIEKRGLPNVRLVHGDMVYFLLNNVRDDSVAAYHVYFPDPWPKRRHKKRRMFHDVSVQQFARTLAPGGELTLKTDVPVNFTRARRAMGDSEMFALEDMRSWPADAAPEDNVPTNFEIKYGRAGKETFYARWRVAK